LYKKTLSLAGNIVSPGIPDFLLAGSPNIGPLSPVDGKIKLRILVDRTSIEIFGNDGEMVMTSAFMPEDGKLDYSLTAKSDIRFVKAEVHSLKSVWAK
jgi:sucrose-6-phosphate hydrolase SacC (GH32 family)